MRVLKCLRVVVVTIAIVGAQTGVWTFSPTAIARHDVWGTPGLDSSGFTVDVTDDEASVAVMVAAPLSPAIQGPYRAQPPPPSGGVVWQDRFDTAPLGQPTKSTGDSLFTPMADPTDDKTYIRSSNAYIHSSIEADPAGGGMLHHTIPAGELGQFTVSPRLTREVEHATLQYDIRFDDNFDWRWGGKMPGLVGVAPGVNIYAPTSGRTNRDVGFSTRLMWNGRGDDGSRPFQGTLGPIPAGRDNDIVTYIYARYPQEGFDGYGWQANLGSELQRGVWHNIKMEVKLNTVGRNDGIYNVWFDDDLRFSASNWNYRNRSDVMIDAVLYDIHRGGGAGSPNWVSSRDTYVDVRNMVVTEVP
jgi:hypothetical protein